MDVLPDALDQLTARLEALERRVDLIERPAPIALASSASPATETSNPLSLSQASGVFSVLGMAMLGIAGAYLLRAVAESTALPKLLIAAIAIVYALLWLAGAARLRAEAWFPSAVYASTSALILVPMLWELTLSFHVLSALAAAAILGAFVVAATALAWKLDRTPLLWVANLAAASEAIALSVATHEFLPFIAVLLLMALLAESAAARNHERSIRPLVAAAADAAIWALIFIYSRPQSARMDYPVLGAAELLLPGSLLILIYAASVALRVTLLGRRISVFETVQAMIAFLLAASSVLTFDPRNGAIALGALCLLSAAASYAAAFLLFANAADSRNFHVFAAWALCLLLAGSLFCLPPLWLALCLGMAAIAATVFAARLALNFHGLVFLLAAAAASGLLAFAFNALAGTLPAIILPELCIISVCAIICSVAGKRDSRESWQRQLLHLATAALAALALAAFLVVALLRLLALLLPPEAHHVAFIRTLVLCALALALALVGSRLRRVELTRIAYAALGLIAAKLLFEDLPLGHMELIAASIFLFAISLIAVPRLARRTIIE